MKRILITGARSYIGTNVEQYLMRYNAGIGKEEYRVDSISQRGEMWETYSFSAYDAVFHVTGIAHVDVGEADAGMKASYYEVNRDLAVQTAQKAKREGVRQFIYMSSVIVYGDGGAFGERKHITAETPANPSNFYGDSKLQAEQLLSSLADDRFQVALVRSPFVYGANCKGNYQTLRKIAGKTPVFPLVENERSMIYIENLAEFIRMLVDSGRGGLFFPQNAKYAATSRMVEMIGQARGKKIWLWKGLNPVVKLVAGSRGKLGQMTNKAFGNMTVDQGLSRRDFDGYQIYTLEESIRTTEQASGSLEV